MNIITYELNKEMLDGIISSKGEMRGVTLSTDESFIIKRFGEKGVKMVEEETELIGYPISYKNINGMEFYPLGMRIVSLVAISRVLKLDQEGVRNMGFEAPKKSLVVKFFMKYFLSLHKTFEKAGEMWEKHYTIGKLEPVDISEEERYAILRLREMNMHPIFCDYLTGYFSSIAKMVVQKEVTGQESKCYFKGDKHHEFVLKW